MSSFKNSNILDSFLECIDYGKYDEAYKLYEKIKESADSGIIANAKYIMLLLSKVITMPSNYQEEISLFEFEDIKHPRYKDKYFANRIRRLVLEGKIQSALKFYENCQNFTSSIIIMEGNLLHKANDNPIDNPINKCDNYILLGQYKEVLKYMNDNWDYFQTNEEYQIIHDLILTYLDIFNKKAIPKKQNNSSETLKDAIDACDYKKALELYCDEYSEKIRNNPMFILLSDICTLIDSLKDGKYLIDECSKDGERKAYKAQKQATESGMYVIIPTTSQIEIDKITKYLQYYVNTKFRVINYNGDELIVVWAIDRNMPFLDFEEEFKKNIACFWRKDYNACISGFIRLIRNPSIFLSPLHLQILGDSYYKTGHKGKAITCFMIASSITRDSYYAEQYMKRAEFLSGTSSFFTKNIAAFKDIEIDFNGEDTFYGINNFLEIHEFIKESLKPGLSIEDICSKMALTREQIYIVILIYAREFYRRKKFGRGDYYVQLVEKQKDKSRKVIDLIYELRRSRNFYRNRVLDKNIVLPLNIEPFAKKAIVISETNEDDLITPKEVVQNTLESVFDKVEPEKKEKPRELGETKESEDLNNNNPSSSQDFDFQEQALAHILRSKVHSIPEIIDFLGISLSDIERSGFKMLQLSTKEDSIHTTRICDDIVSFKCRAESFNNSLEVINSLMDEMSFEEKTIICCRYGLFGYRSHTIEEIADFIGLEEFDITNVLKRFLLNYKKHIIDKLIESKNQNQLLNLIPKSN